MVNNYKVKLVDTVHKQVLALKCKVVLPASLQKFVNDPTKYKAVPQELKQITKLEYVQKLLPYYIEQCTKNEFDLLDKKFHPSKSESEVLKGALKKMFDVFLNDKISDAQFEKTVKESSQIIQDFIIKNRMLKYWGEDTTSKFYASKYSKSGFEGIKKFAAENKLGITLEEKLEHNATRFHELVKFDSMDKFTSTITQTLIQELHKDLADDFRTITMTPEYVCDGSEVFFRGVSLPNDVNVIDWLSENHIAKGHMSHGAWLDYFVNNRCVGKIAKADGRAGGDENGATSVTNDIKIAKGFAGTKTISPSFSYILEVRPKAGTVLTTAVATGQLCIKAEEQEIFFDQISNRDVKIYKLPKAYELFKSINEINNPYYIKRDCDNKVGFVDISKDFGGVYSNEIFASYNIESQEYSEIEIDVEATDDFSLVSREDVSVIRGYKSMYFQNETPLHSVDTSSHNIMLDWT